MSKFFGAPQNNIYESEYRKLPYQVNLLDEIHANENAHTTGCQSSPIPRKLKQVVDTDA